MVGDIGSSAMLTGRRPFRPTSSLAILQHRASHSALEAASNHRIAPIAPVVGQCLNLGAVCSAES